MLSSAAVGMGILCPPLAADSAHQRVALLGCGRRGLAFLETLKPIAGLHLTVCDRDPARLQAAQRQIHGIGYDDWRAALAPASVDAVVVTLPPGDAIQAAQHALDRGMSVLMPFPKEPVPRLLLTRHTAGKRLCFAPERLSGPWTALCDDMRLGRLGRPTWCQVHCRPGPELMEILAVLVGVLNLPMPLQSSRVATPVKDRSLATFDFPQGLTLAVRGDQACTIPRVTLRSSTATIQWRHGGIQVHAESPTSTEGCPPEQPVAVWARELTAGSGYPWTGTTLCAAQNLHDTVLGEWA